MTTRTARKHRRTTQVPVTTMEEVPVLDKNEHAELLGALAAAEADLTAGKGAEYDPKTFKTRLVRIYRGKKELSIHGVPAAHRPARAAKY